MKLKLREAGEKTAFVRTVRGKSKTIEYGNENELTPMKDNPDISGIETAGGKKVKENLVKDSQGQDLVIGDVLEIKNKKFKVQENNGNVCLATMEGKCVMDVTDPRAKTLFENSKKLTKESYEPSMPQEPVISVGHVDDEAGMLKQTVYDVAKYAADLYKRLEQYEALNAHVDFPHWWQAKIVKARDYISMASHYLEYESEEEDISSTMDVLGNLEENNPKPLPSRPTPSPEPDTKPGTAPEPDKRRRINPRPGTKPAPKALSEKNDTVINKIIARYRKEKL